MSYIQSIYFAMENHFEYIKSILKFLYIILPTNIFYNKYKASKVNIFYSLKFYSISLTSWK